MMPFVRIILVVANIISLNHFCEGNQGDKGLLIGVWNPASFLTYTTIPVNSKSSFNNVSMLITPSSLRITSITSDPNNAVIFAAILNKIYIYQNFSIWQNESTSILPIYEGRSSALGQIVFDYVSSNLYWCDALHYWIAMKPAYNRNNSIYKVVVHKDLKQPEGLALDPEDRLMFFSDNGPTPRIEKAYLDGQDREAIVYIGLSRVLSLSLDVLNDKLYWVDVDRHTIEVCNYDGSNRRVIKRINRFQFTDLFYYQGLLHAVSAISKTMLAIDPSSGSELYNRVFSSAQPYTINVYDAETQRSYTDPCSSLSCQHICINTKSGAKCFCSEGYNLAADLKSCTDKSWFFERGFIVSNDTMFVMHEVNSISGQERDYNYYLEVSSAVIETFAVDANSDTIYFVDSKTNTLDKLDIISQQIRTLVPITTGKGLIFDWVAKLLGWIEGQSRINAFSINSGTTDGIYTNLQQVDSLTIDSHNGVLYWISGISGSRSIVRGTWTREMPRVLISAANLNNPSSLQYDVMSHRLYWLDGSLIKSSATNGSDIKSHVIAGFFGWINGDKIYFTRQSALTEETEMNTLQNSKTVAVFDASLQQDKRGTCHILNGGCEDICIPVTNGRRCECDIGLQLQTDNTCDSDALLTDFILVPDFSHERFLQINLQNGSIVKLPISASAPGIVFDKVSKTLFYSDIQQKTIMSTTLHGKNSSLIYTIGVAFASRLAIDYSTGNLYFTAVATTESQSFIGAIHRSLLLHKTVLSNLLSPREIVLYPSKGFLFWVEFGNNTQIGRAHMDGTTKIYIATADLGWPNGLAIDFALNRLYWTDGKTNRIEFSDLNGGNRQVLVTDTDAHLMSLGIYGQYLYYTAWNRQRVTKMDKTTGSKVSFMANHPELGRLDSLDIYADDQIDASLSCSNKNGLCSTFCFPTPSGRMCGCQDNVNLQSDRLTCDGVSQCPTDLPNLSFPNCAPYPGQTCDFECKPGYRSTLNTTIACISGGIWTPNTQLLCEVILCSLSLENAVLSPSCSRRPGNTCSFSCAEGYIPLTSNNLVCGSDGTWNQNTNNLCSRSGCKKTIENGRLTNCQSNIGESCLFECNDPFEVNPLVTNLTCDSNGDWDQNTRDLCVTLCLPTIQNGHLASDCLRQIGNTCSFTCNSNYISSVTPATIICTTGGNWNKDTATLCNPIKCPLEIPFGNLSSSCRGGIGERCSLNCKDDDKTTEDLYVVCLTSGVWDKDTSRLCTSRDQNESNSSKDETDNNVLIYVGVIACSVTMIAIAVVVILCLRKKRRSERDAEKQTTKIDENVYQTFGNEGFEDSFDDPSHVYSAIGNSVTNPDSIYEEPANETYLTA
uniref:Low-density lipoprotein receptor-related protein 4-like isoform X2 n=1 Tax=Crassostrea virginica TaxID=6565 RepID=A0A8B8D6S2_CRAVI|nr:low-density lipoprotein receptor-related protein 4-like isoform X2 [Crassostrea virginica]